MKMTQEQIDLHNENPNICIRMDGVLFRCPCGCNVFHHVDDDEIFICNSCETEYETEK